MTHSRHVRRAFLIAVGVVALAAVALQVFAIGMLENPGFEADPELPDDPVPGWTVSQPVDGNVAVVASETIDALGGVVVEPQTGDRMARLGQVRDQNSHQVKGVTSLSQTFLPDQEGGAMHLAFRLFSWEHRARDSFSISLTRKSDGADVSVLGAPITITLPDGQIWYGGSLPYVVDLDIDTFNPDLGKKDGWDSGWLEVWIENIPIDQGALTLTYELNCDTDASHDTWAYVDLWNAPPVAEFRVAPSDPAPHEGDFVGLYGDFSSDPDGGWDLALWDWTITDPKGTTRAFEGVIPYFIPNSEGDYQISLTVTDRQGATATTETVVAVESFEPRTNALNTEVFPGKSSSLFARYLDTGWLDEHEAQWDIPGVTVSGGGVDGDHTPAVGSGIVTGTVTASGGAVAGDEYVGKLYVRETDTSAEGSDTVTVRIVESDPYALHEQEGDVDDSMANPSELEALDTDWSYQGFLTPGDVDIYRITLPGGASPDFGTEIRAELTGLPADYDLVLLSDKPTVGQDFEFQDAPAYISPAYMSPAYLSPAYMSPAYLSPAYLSPAYLSDADSSPAYMSPAYLSPAYMSPAYMSPAYMSPAYMSSFLHSPTIPSPLTAPAYLSPAYLSPAYLSPAYLSPAYMSPAYLSPAYISPAYMSPAYLSPVYISPAYMSPAYMSPAYLSPAYISPAYMSAALHAPAYLSPAYMSGNPIDGVPLSLLSHASVDSDDVSGSVVDFSEIALDLSDAAAGVDVADYSARRGTEAEVAFTTVETVYTDYYVAVVSSSGSYSASQPYTLRLEASQPFDLVEQLNEGTVFEELVPAPAAEKLVAVDPAPKTLFVTQAERIEATYGSDAWTALESRLASVAARPEVRGTVVSLASSIYDAWDKKPTSVDAANAVTKAIRTRIVAELTANPAIEYVVLVGSDEIVPHRRVLDESVLGNESYYAERGAFLDYDSPLLAAMKGKTTLTNDYYVDSTPIPWSGRALYVPDRTIARLVETPEEICTALDAYIEADGKLDVSSSAAAFVSGHDFMTNGAQLVADMFADANLQTTELLTEDWTGDDVREGLLGDASGELNNFNSHFTHWASMSAQGYLDAMAGNEIAMSEYLQSVEASSSVTADGLPSLNGKLTFGMGCHAGFNVPDGQSLVFGPEGSAGPELDFPQAIARQGGVFIGSTGYGYGDSIGVAGTERLMGLTAYQMLKDGSNTIGKSLTAAKQQYFVTIGAMTYLDEKSLIDYTLYGMPHYTVESDGLSDTYDFSGGGLYNTAEFPLPPNAADAPATFDLSVDGGEATAYALEAVGTPIGTYFTADGNAEFLDGFPVQPKVTLDITAVPGDSTAAHGVLITGGAFEVLGDFDPVVSAYKIDQADTPDEHPSTISGSWPDPPVKIGNDVVTNPDGTTKLRQELIAYAGQYTPYSITPTESADIGDQLLFDTLDVAVLRSSSADWDAPDFEKSLMLTSPDVVSVSVNATDPAGIANVVVLRVDPDQTLTKFDDFTMTGPGEYTVEVPVPAGLDTSELGWIVQVADGAGNVAVDYGKGATPALTVIEPAPDQSSTAGDPVTLTFAIPDFSQLVAPITYFVEFGDGDSESGLLTSSTLVVEHTYPDAGTYAATLRVEDSAGGTGSSSAQVTVASTVEPPPAAPMGLAASDVPDDEGGAIALSWLGNQEDDLSGYIIYRNGSSIATISAVLPSYVDATTADGVTYTYTVTAFNFWSMESDPSVSASAASADNLAPAAPTGLTASDVPGDQGGAVALSWDANTESDLLGYNVYRDETQLSTLTTATAFTDEFAVDGEMYDYHVTAVDTSDNESAHSDFATAMSMDNLAPPAPVSLSAADAPDDEGGAIELSWVPDDVITEDLAGFNIYRDETLLCSVFDSTSYVDETVTDGVTYDYTVTAFDTSDNESEHTDFVTATSADNLAPAAPTGVSAADVPDDEGGAIAITWDANTESDLDGYNVYRNGFLLDTVIPLVGYTDETAVDGVTYSYTVTAFDTSANESTMSAQASAASADNLVPAPPTGLSASDVPGDEGGAIELTWDANTESDLVGYRVYRDETQLSTLTAAAEFTDATAVDGVSYTYAVTAVDISGNESGYGVFATAMSSDNLAPAAPTGVSASDVPDDQGGAIELTWDANGEADLAGYRLYRRDYLSPLGTYDTPYVAYDVAVEGGVAYVADATSIQVIDVSDPSIPTLLGSESTFGSAMKIAVSGDVAFTAERDQGIVGYDVSTPSAPAALHFCDTPGDALDVAIVGDYVYVADADAGLQIVDVSSPAASPIVGTYDTPGNATGIAVAGGIAYVTDGDDGLLTIDVSNPAAPMPLGTCDTPVYAADVAVDGEIAYVADMWGGMHIIDASDPSSPFIMGTCPTDYALGVSISGDIAYVADEGGGFRAIDVSNPTAPTILATGGAEYAFGVAVVDDIAYVADHVYGLRMIGLNVQSLIYEGTDTDHTDETTIDGKPYSYAVTAFDTSDNQSVESSSVRAASADNLAPAAPTGLSASDVLGDQGGAIELAWDANVEPDLAGYNLYRESAPALLSTYASPSAQDVFLVGDILYVADTDLLIIDVNDPWAPTLIGTYDTPTQALGVTVVDGTAYVAAGTSGLHVIDVNDPWSPVLLGSCDTPYMAEDVSVVDGFAYVADSTSGLQVIDVNDPHAPTLIGSDDSVFANGVAVIGDSAFVAGGLSGLHVFDISDPSAPDLVTTWDTPGSAYDVTVDGDTAYIGDGPSGLAVADVSNPAVPTLLGSCDTPHVAEGVTIAGGVAYVADANSGLHAIDVTDPHSPTILASYDTDGYARNIAVRGDVAFVADNTAGLHAIGLSTYSLVYQGADPFYADSTTLDGLTYEYTATAFDTSGNESDPSAAASAVSGAFDVQKVLAGDGAAGDNLGVSVAIDGDTAVIGAPGDDSGKGSAYVLTRTGATWIEQAKLTAADGVGGDSFGLRVALDGDTAVIGAHGDDSGKGSAYVFTRSGGTWTEQIKLTADDGAAGDQFGKSVALDGDTAVIGAPLDDNTASDSGSAYVFTRTGSTWTQQAKLIAADPNGNDQFGISVSVDGDTTVIGVWGDDDLGFGRGSAYVFARTGTTWAQQAKLNASDGAMYDGAGYAVAVDGDTAVVGAYGEMGYSSGSAYVYTRTGTTWAQQATLKAEDGVLGDNFGISVALDGDTAVIGARYDDSSRGSAYVFTRSGGTWIEQIKLTADDGAAGDQFGISVALDGDTAVIGAYGDDDKGADSGSVHFVSHPLDPAPPEAPGGLVILP